MRGRGQKRDQRPGRDYRECKSALDWEEGGNHAWCECEGRY